MRLSHYRVSKVTTSTTTNQIIMNTIKRTFLLIAALAAFIPLAPAATVIWGSPTNISGNTDVSTTGSFVQAYHFGDYAGTTSATVNGVLFSATGVYPFPNGTNSEPFGGVNSLTSTGTIYGYNGFGSSATPYSALSPEYRNLLSSAVIGFTGSMTFTLNGLTSGQDYQIQFFSNDSSDLVGPNIARATSITSGNTVTLVSNTAFPNGTPGGTGQWVIGAFNAVGTSQVFTFEVANNAFELNGYQLRAVPEPATWMLMALSGAFLMVLRRRRVA